MIMQNLKDYKQSAAEQYKHEFSFDTDSDDLQVEVFDVTSPATE